MNQFDNRRGKSRSANLATTSEEPSFRISEENDIWDFSRDSQGFKFNRRPVSQPDFQLVGTQAATDHAAAGILDFPALTASRPNSHNRSVKMVSGDLQDDPWFSRTNSKLVKLPIMGEVAAGKYDVTVAYFETGYDENADFVLVDNEQVRLGKDTFALRVRGTSMVDNEIEDGDVIIVQRQNTADDGDFVVACLTDSSDDNGFVTLKRFYRNRYSDRVVLQPANASLNPIHIRPRRGDAKRDDLDGVKIQGKVTTIIKVTGLEDSF